MASTWWIFDLQIVERMQFGDGQNLGEREAGTRHFDNRGCIGNEVKNDREKKVMD